MRIMHNDGRTFWVDTRRDIFPTKPRTNNEGNVIRIKYKTCDGWVHGADIRCYSGTGSFQDCGEKKAEYLFTRLIHKLGKCKRN